MPRKKPLVEDARGGLDVLKHHLFEQINRPDNSYRDRFRSLARQRAALFTRSDDRPEGPKSPRGR